VEYKFTLPAHWNGMEVTVILNGLEPADGKLTGGSGNTYTYKPAAGGAQTLTLRTIDLEEKECTITLKDDGYNDETDRIDQRGAIVIPAGNLRTSTDVSEYVPLYLYSTNPGTSQNPTSLASITEITRTGSYGNRVYSNTNAIQVAGVSLDDTIYVRYVRTNNWGNTYYVASFKLSDAVKEQVTLNFQRVYN
jgi:hypothetical protein